jgi:catechol 2,3-dioxygenase-like lactoylglutathione lyase family enzyme
VNLLRAATLVVRDPAATAARYERWLDYAIVEEGQIGEALAAAWGAPAAAGRVAAVCGPASGAEVFLRFVQGEVPDDYRPLRTFGWAALEICVADVLSVAERLAHSPFEIIGPPKELEGMPQIFPMQVRGPDQEIIYLTQIREQPAGVRLAAASCPIDRLFIAVLACSDLGATARWFRERLGLAVHPSAPIRYTMLSKAFGMPADARHVIATGGHGIDTFLELDQYPPEGAPRPRASGSLPPGVAIITLQHPDLEAIAPDAITSPAHLPGIVYAGAAQAMASAPDGTLVELIG